MDILIKRLAVAAALAAGAAASAGALAPGAVIKLIPNGPVDVRSGAGTSWRPVAGPEDVTAGQEVRTHRDSTAQLDFPDGSKVLINSFSIFAIDKTDDDEASFSLKLGRIRAAFAGLFSSRISIRTPTAVAAVRGTVFDMGTDQKGTDITMAEGVLEVKDKAGKEAVVTSEEQLHVGDRGLERPRMLSLNDSRSLPAVRPYAVHQDMARDATRKMLEDIRNRELKANEAQLGKDVVDAFGRRVRLEEYLLRPDTKSFEVLFLNHRQDRFDWGHVLETFNAAIPSDLSQVPAIIDSTFGSAARQSNWLKSMEFYATNTIDAEKEVMNVGNPAQIDFSGFGRGMLWYPSSIDFTQTLFGPGVPNGERVQFSQAQSWNSGTGLFLFVQAAQTGTPTTDNLTPIAAVTLDPTSAANVAAGGTALSSIVIGGTPYSVGSGTPGYDDTNPTAPSYPSGPNKADVLTGTTYADGSTVSVEKFLVGNDGKVLDLSNPDYGQNGSYNLEFNIKSSLFQGRDIDVLVAPEILNQTAKGSSAPSDIVP